MPFKIVIQDITKMDTDAIVNAANTELLMGGGVCGAIFKAAGAAKLQAACDELAPIKTGEAVVTPGFDLPAKYIIHAAGPVYREWGREKSEQLLRIAYTNSLQIAVEKRCESISFPLISSGIYGYPKNEALQVASSAIQDFLKNHDLNVTLVFFDKSAFVISRELLGEVDLYIDEHYVDERFHEWSKMLNLGHEGSADGEEVIEHDEAVDYHDAIDYNRLASSYYPIPSADTPASGEGLIGSLDDPFSQMLLSQIHSKGMSDEEVCRRANLDLRWLCKIRNNKDYVPDKYTAIALVLALKLSSDEADAFLERAGHSFSQSEIFDVIIQYFITHGKYDIFTINEMLFQYDLPLLG